MLFGAQAVLQGMNFTQRQDYSWACAFFLVKSSLSFFDLQLKKLSIIALFNHCWCQAAGNPGGVPWIGSPMGSTACAPSPTVILGATTAICAKIYAPWAY